MADAGDLADVCLLVREVHLHGVAATNDKAVRRAVDIFPNSVDRDRVPIMFGSWPFVVGETGED